MGVATTNVFDRVLASIGGSESAVESHFEHCEDVRSGGVLLALPALLSCGLLRHSERFFSLPGGYYKLVNIFLLLAMMSLNRVNSIEQLRYCSPGEWGKLLGLDRCPCVKTLRQKIQQITGNEESVKGWASALSKDWIEAEATCDMAAGTLYYVDGHLRVPVVRRRDDDGCACVPRMIIGLVSQTVSLFSKSTPLSILVCLRFWKSKLCPNYQKISQTNPVKNNSPTTLI